VTVASTALESLLSRDPSTLGQDEKAELLAGELSRLTHHHWERCAPYRRILESSGVGPPFTFSVEEVPALPVSLFKEFDLRSIDEAAVARVLRSSGTTGQTPSRVYLDTETSRLQTRALVRIFQRVIGTQRLPMLIVDQDAVVGDHRSFTARGAGVLGLANFGRDHTYALDADMRIRWEAIDAFAKRHAGERVLVFGFTFMIWKHFVAELRGAKRPPLFENGVLVHSGGWKKLADEAVDRDTFRRYVADATGVRSIYDFYGMVEQVGSVFVECDNGALHPPPFADIVIRDVRTWRSLGVGETGVIQVLSLLPRSYPGHSLLTEDLGQLVAEDDCSCGQRGRAFRVLGRVPKAELRGCSDTFAVQT
jgi:acyl-protein synthetase LuxE